MSEASGKQALPDMPVENIYGHVQRLDWVQRHVPPPASILEVGCGTGYMITYPLLRMGYDVTGVDIDEPSIRLGRKFLRQQGLDPSVIRATDLWNVGSQFDAIILSEVLEHVHTEEYGPLFGAVKERLKPGGQLLVTVPNGYGWFEMESFLWNRLGLGPLLERTRIAPVVHDLKNALLGRPTTDQMPSTLAESPHVQRFTAYSIQRLLARHGFEPQSVRGSVLVAGPLSSLLFSGVRWIMAMNKTLGRMATPVAAGFYVTAKPAEERELV